MEINYQEIIQHTASSLKKIQQAQPPTQDRLEAFARMMAKQGYQHTESSLKALEAVLSGYGVLISGQTGTGKTMFFETLYKKTPKHIFSATYIAASFNPRSLVKWLSEWNTLDFVVDDLGAEPYSNDFGNKIELLPIVVELRIRLKNVRTHFTTNLTARQISERYGERTLDRILGLCKPYRLDGESHRQPTAINVN